MRSLGCSEKGPRTLLCHGCRLGLSLWPDGYSRNAAGQDRPQSVKGIAVDLIGVIIAGIIIGLLGKFVAPGDRDNIPLWLTIVCGIGGVLIGYYLAAALGLSYYARRKIGARLWRKLHRATFLVWLLALVHTIGAGSDAKEPWLAGFMLVTAVPILMLLGVRTLSPPAQGAKAS